MAGKARALAAGWLLLPGAVLAQTETPDEIPGEIVVTAQRRAERADDVPIALSVLTGDQLANRGVTGINQLQFQTPSLEVVPAFGGGQPQFRLRGVGFEDYATNNAPTVGVYVDEVAFPVPVMTQGALFDLSRVEVLRGPQGTLYGRNTTGGAINFVTNRPTAAFAAGLSGEYGRFGEAKAEGFLSGPVAQNLRVRLAGITEQGGGFQRNRATGEPLGDADRLFGRALLEWTPGTATITANLHGGRDRSEQTGLRLLSPFVTRGYGTAPGPTIPADTSRRATGWGFASDFLALNGYDPGSRPQRDTVSYGASLTAAIDLGAARLTSISSYDHLDRRELADWDASASRESDVFWQSDIDVLSQELRLASAEAARLQWVGGFYASRQTLDETFRTDFRDSLGIVTDTAYRQSAWSIAGFGQASYRLADPLTLTAGLRYEHEERALRGFRTAVAGVPLFAGGDRDQGLDELTGRLALDWRPRDGLLLYASASRGVKSGGFTVYNSPQADQINAFDPETLYAYEVGAKARAARWLRITAAAFYYDYRDQQVLGTLVNPNVGQIGRIVNAPRSRLGGAELEVEITPAPRLRLTQALAWKSGEYRRFADIDQTSVVRDPVTGLYSGRTIDKAGQRLPIANWSWNGSATYAAPIGRHSLEGEVDASYRDTLPSFLGADYALPTRWVVNASLTFRMARGWSVGAYARNLLNERYDLARNFFLPNARIAATGRPATYGIRVGVTY